MMHRAVRSIIPQEVAMFDFLKQKDQPPRPLRRCFANPPLPTGEARNFPVKLLALPLGELSPQVTERVSTLKKERCVCLIF